MTLSISTRDSFRTVLVRLQNGNTTTTRPGEITVFNMMYEKTGWRRYEKECGCLRGLLMLYLHAYCLALAYGEPIGRFGAQLDTRIA